jgi:hypothetical protein
MTVSNEVTKLWEDVDHYRERLGAPYRDTFPIRTDVTGPDESPLVPPDNGNPPAPIPIPPPVNIIHHRSMDEG